MINDRCKFASNVQPISENNLSKFCLVLAVSCCAAQQHYRLRWGEGGVLRPRGQQGHWAPCARTGRTTSSRTSSTRRRPPRGSSQPSPSPDRRHWSRRSTWGSSVPSSRLLQFRGVYTLELSQKSNFQPSTIKLDNKDHLTAKSWEFGPLRGFKTGFLFCEKLKYSVQTKKS